MNKVLKRASALTIAAILAIGMQVVTFATTSGTDEADGDSSTSTSTQSSEASEPEEDEAGEIETTAEASTTAAAQDDGPISTSPNTGVPMAPIAAAALAIASVPVILKTRK